MLELIVLGAVPGTQFEITFGQAAVGLLLLFLISTHSRENKKTSIVEQRQIEDIAL